MLIINSIEELKDVIFRIKSSGKSIGLVPTMGALHQGHLSLIETARKENEVTVCSIFVNPLQFNNANDLKNYPRDNEKDEALISPFVDILFLPTENAVYPEVPTENYHFGNLETVMEGVARSGHFNGVAIIVKRLFDWITPDKAYFGEKDYQQLRIIKQLIKNEHIDIQIVSCPIIRESNGLAMSSRNRLLSPAAFQTAANIYRILLDSKNYITSIEKTKQFVTEEFAKIKEFRLEYFEIADDTDLQAVNDWQNHTGVIGFVAVTVENVRLIDNIRYK